MFAEQEAPDAAATTDHVPTMLGERPYHVLGTSETVVAANWKILVEGFLEGYHLKATHRDTFFPYGYDNINVVEYDGADARITFPFRRIERLRPDGSGKVPAAERRIDGSLTRVHLMFPNVIIAELSAHITMVVLEPLTVSTTTFITYQVGPLPPTDGLDVDGDGAGRDCEGPRIRRARRTRGPRHGAARAARPRQRRQLGGDVRSLRRGTWRTSTATCTPRSITPTLEPTS